MSEFNQSNEFDQNNELQISIKKYSSFIEHMALQYPVADSEEYPVYETPRFDLQELNGNPIKVSFAHYPNGQEHFLGVKNATIIESESPGLGKWVKNYHIYDDINGGLAWEKSEWFIPNVESRERLSSGDDALTLTDEMQTSADRTVDAGSLNPADRKAYTAGIFEQLTNPNFEVPEDNELSLLQYYIDQLT